VLELGSISPDLAEAAVAARSRQLFQRRLLEETAH